MATRTEKLKIYKADGSSFYDVELESHTFTDASLGFNTTITGSFVTPIRLQDEFTMSEYVEYQTQPTGDKTKFYLISRPTQTRSGDKDAALYRYACKFNTPSIELSTMPLVNDLQMLRTFGWFGSALDLFELIERNLTNGWTIESHYESEQLSDKIPPELISFSDATIESALKIMYEHFDLSFNTQDRKIWIGKPVNTVPHIFELGKGLKTENITPKDNTIYTKVLPIGTDKNLPYPYPRLYKADGTMVTTYASIDKSGNRTNLPLHKNTLMPSVYRETLQAQIDFFESNGWDYAGLDFPEVKDYYIASGDTWVTQYTDDLPLVGYYTDEDVYPTIKDVEYEELPIDVVNEVIFDDDDNDNINTETGEVEKSFFNIKLNPMGFDLWAAAAARKAMSFAMLSGDCRGADFKVAVSEEDWNRSFYITGSEEQNDKIDSYLTIIEFNDEILEENNYYEQKSLYIEKQKELRPKQDALKECQINISRLQDALAIVPVDTGLSSSLAYYNNMASNLRSEISGLQAEIAAIRTPDYIECERLESENSKYWSLISELRKGMTSLTPIFTPDSPYRDYEQFPDSTDQSITIRVYKDIDTFGYLVPWSLQKPTGGDKFSILGIELPLYYITQSEAKMSNNGLDWLMDNNYAHYEYPFKLDEGFLELNPEIASQITTNAVLVFRVGNVVKSLAIQNVTKKHLESAITTYDVKCTDELSVSTNPVNANTSKIKEQEVIIRENKIKGADTARRNNYATQKAVDAVFDSEGNNRVDKVEALSVFANAAIFGQNPNDFAIESPSMAINNTSNVITLSPTKIIHFWSELDSDIDEWNINEEGVFTLDPTKQYYVYVKANRTNDTAYWDISDEQIKYNEGTTLFHFVAGQFINFDGIWTYVGTNGLTQVLGGTISTHITKSPNFLLTQEDFAGMMIDFLNAKIYMGEDAEIITNSITFRRPNEEDVDAFDFINEANTNATNAANAAEEAKAAVAAEEQARLSDVAGLIATQNRQQAQLDGETSQWSSDGSEFGADWNGQPYPILDDYSNDDKFPFSEWGLPDMNPDSLSGVNLLDGSKEKSGDSSVHYAWLWRNIPAVGTSVTYSGTNNSGKPLRLFMSVYDSEGNTLAFDLKPDLLQDGEKGVVTFSNPLIAKVDCGVFADTNQDVIGNYKFNDLKLELGNEATSWSPSLPDQRQTILNRHLNDIFTNVQTYVDETTTPFSGKSWKFDNVSRVAPADISGWNIVANGDSERAYLKAAQAQASADGKNTTYQAKPNPIIVDGKITNSPYKKGDTWLLAEDVDANYNAATGDNVEHKKGSLIFCNTNAVVDANGSWTFDAAHWEDEIRYTDDTAVNNLQIGGVNLINDTSFKQGMTSANSSWAAITLTDTLEAIGNLSSSSLVQGLNLEVGEHIVSFIAKNKDEGLSSQVVITGDGNYPRTEVLTDEWKRYNIHFTMNSARYFTLRLYSASAYPNDFLIKSDSLMLVEGNKAPTSWSPSEADRKAAIDAVQENLDNLEIAGDNILLKGANSVIDSTSYLVATRYTTTQIKAGKKYTLMLDGKTQVGQQIRMSLNGAIAGQVYFSANQDGLEREVFTASVDNTVDYISFFNEPSSSDDTAKTATIRWCALYEGDVKAPKEWIPTQSELAVAYDNQMMNTSPAFVQVSAQSNMMCIGDFSEQLMTLSLEVQDVDQSKNRYLELYRLVNGIWVWTDAPTIHNLPASGKVSLTFITPPNTGGLMLVVPLVTGAIQVRNLMLQKHNKATAWKSENNTLNKAIQGSTTIEGGLVLGNMMAVTDTDGNVKAGMNGIEDSSVAFWAGGSMEDAESGNVPVLITQEGVGSKIGIFTVQEDRMAVTDLAEESIILTNKDIEEVENQSETINANTTSRPLEIYANGQGITESSFNDSNKTILSLSQTLGNGNYTYSLNLPMSVAVTSDDTAVRRPVRSDLRDLDEDGFLGIKDYSCYATADITVTAIMTVAGTVVANKSVVFNTLTQQGSPAYTDNKNLILSGNFTANENDAFTLTIIASGSIEAGHMASYYNYDTAPVEIEYDTITGYMYSTVNVRIPSALYNMFTTEKEMILAKDGISVRHSSDSYTKIKRGDNGIIIQFVGLPSYSTSLETGQLYKDENGFLKIK